MKRTSIRIVLSFFLAILSGSVLLYLFGYTNPETDRNWLDTFFTATSGICVTGLTVMNISQSLNMTGQVILLSLIQIGGLGVLTISNWLALSFTGRLNVMQVDTTNRTMGYLHKVPTKVYIRRIIIFTLLTELLGAAILFGKFITLYPVKTALWFALFHSVSAFCNAGFSLFSSNLEGFSTDCLVNFTIMFLIVIGGAGFVVIIDVYEYFRSRLHSTRARLSLQSAITLSATAWLIFGGAAMIYFLELNNTLKERTLFKGILESLFLSVTSRTAGFSTIPTAELTSMSLFVVITLMFIGASSGSTGGGIKTSTAAVFAMMLKASFKKRDNVEIFRRTIGHGEIARVVSIVVCYLLTMFVAITLLQIVETSGMDPRTSRGTFLEHLFEVVSALSTVGLSTGVTPTLTAYGKGIIMFCMFAGRVGLLALIATVIGRQKKLLYSYPVENIMVG